MMRNRWPIVLTSVALLALTACASEYPSSEETQAGAPRRERTGEQPAASLEQWIRSGFEFSWQSGQPMRDEVRQVWSQLGQGGVGYGFRTFQARGDTSSSTSDQTPQAVLASMEHWRVTLDELHTSVVGEIGLVWGVYTEEFKAKGQAPETVRVRFTNTLRWDGQEWANLLYHRDAQVFGENGGYVVPLPGRDLFPLQ